MTKKIGKTGKKRAARDPEGTREALLEAGERVLLALGPDAVTVNAVAKASGVTKSLAFYHFHSRQELFDVIKRRLYGSFAVLAQARLDMSDAVAGLEASIRGYFGFLQAEPNSSRLLSWIFMSREMPSGDLASVHAQGMEVVERAQEEGALRDDISPNAVVAVASSLIEHWFEVKHLYDGRIPGRRLSDDEYLEAVVAILKRGLAPAGESNPKPERKKST